MCNCQTIYDSDRNKVLTDLLYDFPMKIGQTNPGPYIDV